MGTKEENEDTKGKCVVENTRTLGTMAMITTTDRVTRSITTMATMENKGLGAIMVIHRASTAKDSEATKVLKSSTMTTKRHIKSTGMRRMSTKKNNS